ncbi:hypothetical protein IHV12_19680 [Fictibacillus sp. 7GRE50]|uniref:hypothetical protein n=1 Tax=Fictibacillus sp. 7GRE50 TaxID=2745878 RepID=UPI0018CE58F3|nr:hypothetical protein [Fictibacillus sp. 7GRE50]MBH0167149.1 hypothetical protein [Fictibacillus sp. 7GRE50]
MKDIIVFTLILPFVLYFLFTPILNDIENARGKIIQGTIQKATEKASLEGYFTPEIKEDIYKDLEEIGYDRNKVELELTGDIKMRGEYVEGTIKAPNEYHFILSKLISSKVDSGNPPHIKSSSRMSEYVN